MVYRAMESADKYSSHSKIFRIGFAECFLRCDKNASNTWIDKLDINKIWISDACTAFDGFNFLSFICIVVRCQFKGCYAALYNYKPTQILVRDNLFERPFLSGEFIIIF